MRGLAGKVALVTGGASGLGKAIVERFVAEGTRVVIADIDEAAGRQVAEANACRFVRTDVTDPASVQAAIAFVASELGRLDILVNNAGVESPQAPTHLCTLETWRRVTETNLGGVFYGLKYGIEQFLRQGGGGAVVNMSSVAGIIGYPTIPSYVAAKGGISNLTRAAAVEYGEHRIRVNAVAPTAVRTEMNLRQIARAADPDALRAMMESMNPLKGMPTPEDVASAVAFLASDEAAFVSGVVLPVDGGYTAR